MHPLTKVGNALAYGGAAVCGLSFDSFWLGLACALSMAFAAILVEKFG